MRNKKGARRALLRCLSVCLAAVLLLGLSGCKSGVPLSRRMLLQGLCIDRSADSLYTVTAHISRIGEGLEGQVDVLTAKGASVKDALTNLTQIDGHDPSYSHNMLLVFGPGCCAQGLYGVLDFFVRFHGSNGKMRVAATQQPDGKLFQLKDGQDSIPAKKMSDLIASGELNGKVPDVDLLTLSNMLSGQGSAYLPLLGIADGKPVAQGLAYFHEDKLAGTLIGAKARGAMALLGRIQNSAYVLQAPGLGKVTLDTDRVEPAVKASVQGGKARFQISLRCTASIDAIDAAPGAADSSAHYGSFARLLRQNIQQEAQGALQACVAKNADIFSFTRRLQQAAPAYWKKEHAAFAAHMASADYAIQVSADVLHVGQERTPGL